MGIGVSVGCTFNANASMVASVLTETACSTFAKVMLTYVSTGGSF